MIKTLKKWEKSDLDLDKYLCEPCQIDEELHSYISEIVAPQYLDGGLNQGGDAMKSDESEVGEKIYYYMTVSIVNDKYFYLGVLPYPPGQVHVVKSLKKPYSCADRAF